MRSSPWTCAEGFAPTCALAPNNVRQLPMIRTRWAAMHAHPTVDPR